MKKLWILLLIASLGLLMGCDKAKENVATGVIPQNAGRAVYQGEKPVSTIISFDEALSAALSHAQVPQANAYKIEYAFDYDDPIPHYEISFKVENTEYDYDVHAETGEIVEWEKEAKHGATPGPADVSLSKEAIKAIALAHAGVQEQNVRQLEMKLDTEDGIPVYEIEFHSGVYEYEYDIQAETGAVLKFQRER